MEQWIVACNLKYYDVFNAFKKLKRLDWKQSVKSIAVGDEVFIYVGIPIKAVKYKCRVNKINLCSAEIDDSEFVIDGEPYENYGNYMELELLETYDDNLYALNNLRKNGLKGNIQGPRHASGLIK